MQGNQQVLISNKNSVRIDKVKGVISLDEDHVLIDTELGLISIEGKELKLENLEKATGEINIIGNIAGLFYVEKREKKRGRGVIS